MKWSQHAWNEASPVYKKILDLDFIRELMSGQLDRKKFLFYIGQDALYLSGFGKVLAGIASRLDNPEHTAAYLSFAGDSVAVEKALHQSFLNPQGGEQPIIAEPSPSCLLYTSYLLSRLAVAPVEVVMASTLPCFWVYKEVGDYILKYQTKDNNPYQSWIDTYGGEEYNNAVQKAIALCDGMADAATPEIREAMTHAYFLGTRMEWMFWESAYRMEDWPV